MVAHIVHDSQGTIKFVAILASESKGDLEIQPEKDEVVTIVDLSEAFPAESSTENLQRIGRDIRSNFRLDMNRKTLERLK